MGKNAYLCIEMSGKGSISRMSDECLMKQEMVIPFYVVYQAVMRKFTLTDKTDKEQGLLDMLLGTSRFLTRLSDSSFFDFG